MTMLPAGWGPGWALGVVALWVVCEGSGCSSQAWGELQAHEQAATRWPLLPPANQRPASSLTTATHCSSRNVTVEGPCESLETARLLASPPLLHSRSVVVGIQFSVFVLACTPVALCPPAPVVSCCWHTRRRKFTPPTPLLALL